MIVKISYKPIQYNHSSRNGHKVKFLVIHDTGNTSKGANAMNHYKYFSGGNRGASAHYFVDDNEIIQIVGDSRSAWSVGDNQGQGRYLNGARNQNSISIELCVNKDGDYDKAFMNTVELTKQLMKKFNIDHEHVCRHYDVSKKLCPRSMSENNWAKWKEFKTLLRSDSSMTEKEVRKIAREEIAKAEHKPDKGKHWADKALKSLKKKGIDIHERRLDDNITRAEVFSLLDRIVK